MTRTVEKFHSSEPHDTIRFVNPSLSNSLLDGLNSLREQGKLFDINLIVQGQLFRTHKVVLSACSDYFRAMFTDNMLESRQDEICLNGITCRAFQQLLDYAYTAKLSLNLVNVQEVLEAASLMQFDDVIRMCSNYLQAIIDIENCVDIATIAERYSLKRLALQAYQFMSEHLSDFSGSKEFYRLSPTQLQNLLSCDFPVDCSEDNVFRIVLSWFFHIENSKIDSVMQFAEDIINGINFSEIPRRKLENIMEKMFHDSMYHRDLYRIIMTEMHLQTRLCSGEGPQDLLNTRGMGLAVLKVGGFGPSGITNEITYRFSSATTWKHLTSIPHVDQCNFGTAVFNNELYVIGGCFNQALQENIHPFGFKYNPSCDKWSTIAPMKVERCRFTLNVLGSMLYAIGGDTEGDELDSRACESYNTSTDTWSLIQPLPVGLIQHAGASYEDSFTKMLFISGGVDRNALQSAMYCYDIATDKWRICAPMLKARADHAMVSFGKFLYVCGGWAEDPETRMRVHVETIDIYSIETDQWSVLTTVPTPRFHAGIVGHDGLIYFIGGFQSDAMFDKDTAAAIERYDIEADLWTVEDKYPQDIWEHTCATLYIPRCREDMEIISGGSSK